MADKYARSMEDLLARTVKTVLLAEQVKTQRTQFVNSIKHQYIERCLREGTVTAIPSSSHGGEHEWMRKHMLHGLHVVVNHRPQPPEILATYWACQTEAFVCEAIRQFEAT